VSFALGWLFAVSIYPDLRDSSRPSFSQDLSDQPEINSQKNTANSTSQTNSSLQKEISKKEDSFINSSLFKSMRDNVMIIFDPYEIDRLTKEDTLLKSKNSYINKDIESKDKEIKTKKKETVVSLPHKKKPRQKPNLKKDLPTPNPAKQKSPSTQKLKLESFFQEQEKKYNETNKEQLLAIEKQQDFFKSTGKFSFLVNVFSKEEKAIEYIETMKKDYPFWSFLLKSHGDHIRIYLGPFVSREEALKFKKELSFPYPFSSLEYLEEVAL